MSEVNIPDALVKGTISIVDRMRLAADVDSIVHVTEIEGGKISHIKTVNEEVRKEALILALCNRGYEVISDEE